MATSYLVFGDGTVLEGVPFGHEGDSVGEVVFTTSMDYQDSFTDASNHGSILIFTYPLIGDYGVTDAYSALAAWPSGIVVREYCKQPSEMYGGRDIDGYMKEKKVVGISGIDTRALVIKIRESGTFKGAIVRNKKDIKKTIDSLADIDDNVVMDVTRKDVKTLDNGKGLKVGVLDCGIKPFYVDELSKRFDLVLFPAGTSEKDIKASGVKGLIISDGPGNPSKAPFKAAVKALEGKMPILGIGFGGCVAAEAAGAKVEKMKFGHRGGQSVEHEDRVLITTQNRGYAIEPKSAEKAGFVIDQRNLNDRSVEGLVHKKKPLMIAEYYPEVVEGCSGTSFVYDSFEKMMKEAGQ